jgi:hypothetical protein
MTTAVPLALSAGGKKTQRAGLSRSVSPTAPGAPEGHKSCGVGIPFGTANFASCSADNVTRCCAEAVLATQQTINMVNHRTVIKVARIMNL